MTGFHYPTAFSKWGEEENAAIDRVRASGRWTMGPEVEAFEEEFAAFHGRRHGIMVNSGSSANLIATNALFTKRERPLHHGDRVGVPALAWSTTYAPLYQHGMKLELMDVDETWNASHRHIWKGVPKLIVACSVLGNPAYLAWWRNEAARLGAYLLEDNCESVGAVAAGDPDALTGTFGTLSTFSLFYSHQISAIEGGMVLTDDDDLATLCRMLRDHGSTRTTSRRVAGFEGEYDFRLMGFNVRPLEMHAAIARAQLRRLKDMRGWRRANYELFRVSTGDLPIQMAKEVGSLSPFGIHFTCPSGRERATIVDALRAAGIDCRLPTGGSFLRHDYGKRWRDQVTPKADRIHDLGLFIGNAPFDIGEMVIDAAAVIEKALMRRAA